MKGKMVGDEKGNWEWRNEKELVIYLVEYVGGRRKLKWC